MKSADLLTGDFDSITNETLAIIKQSNTKIIETTNQDETDFTKALQELRSHDVSERNVNFI